MKLILDEEITQALVAVGDVFGKLTVTEIINRMEIICSCQCGNSSSRTENQLIKGYIKSCGCLGHKKKEPLEIGSVFGKLTVIGEEYRGKHYTYKCKVSCTCGNVLDVSVNSLRNGHTASCGCLANSTHATHKMSGTRPYRIYRHIMGRCLDENNPAYSYYGGRGISVCDRWKSSFINFWEDMKDGYDDTLTIDRIDTNLGYSKENCRWATRSMQSFNRRRSDTYNTSGRTGVYWDKEKSKWNPKIAVQYKQKHLGYFDKFEDAVKARVEAEILYFGEENANA